MHLMLLPDANPEPARIAIAHAVRTSRARARSAPAVAEPPGRDSLNAERGTLNEELKTGRSSVPRSAFLVQRLRLLIRRCRLVLVERGGACTVELGGGEADGHRLRRVGEGRGAAARVL